MEAGNQKICEFCNLGILGIQIFEILRTGEFDNL